MQSSKFVRWNQNNSLETDEVRHGLILVYSTGSLGVQSLHSHCLFVRVATCVSSHNFASDTQNRVVYIAFRPGLEGGSSCFSVDRRCFRFVVESITGGGLFDLVKSCSK